MDDYREKQVQARVNEMRSADVQNQAAFARAPQPPSVLNDITSRLVGVTERLSQVNVTLDALHERTFGPEVALPPTSMSSTHDQMIYPAGAIGGINEQIDTINRVLNRIEDKSSSLAGLA
jgi:hypothetical protein